MTEPATFLGMADLSESGITTRGTPMDSDATRSGYTPFRDSDLLVAKITPCFENGKIGQALLPTKLGWGSSEFHVVRPDREQANDRYVMHYLRSPIVRARGIARMTGSGGQRRVPVSFIGELPVPLPPLGEQRRIAAILDEADSMRTAAWGAIEHIDKTEDEYFAAHLEPVTRSNHRLQHIAEEFRYGTSEKSSDGALPVLRIPNVTGRGLDVTDLKYVDLASSEAHRLTLGERDVLFVRSNGNRQIVGRSSAFSTLPQATRTESWVFASYLIRARLKPGIDPRAVVAMSRSSAGRRHFVGAAATSAGQFNISIPVLKSLPLFDPQSPALPEFSRLCDSLDNRRATLTRRAGLVDALFTSLQHRAFRGEL